MDMVRRRAIAMVLAVAAAVALAGCTGAAADAETPSPTRIPSPSSTAAATATSQPTPSVDPADPATWVITFDGIGPLKAHGALDDVPAELAEFSQLAAPDGQCQAYVYRLEPTLRASAWADPADQTHVAEATVSWMGSSDAPAAADVARSPRTERGIGIGSSIAELHAAYPELTVTREGAVPTYGVGDGTRWILFRDLWGGGTVSAIQVGVSTWIANEIC